MTTPTESVRYPFAVDADAGRLAQEPDHDAHVAQLIRQLLLTSPGERINRPDFGCGLRRMVFAASNSPAADLLQVMVTQSLEKWLSTVIAVDSVRVQAVDERLVVRLAYRLKTRGERRFLNLEVTP